MHWKNELKWFYAIWIPACLLALFLITANDFRGYVSDEAELQSVSGQLLYKVAQRTRTTDSLCLEDSQNGKLRLACVGISICEKAVQYRYLSDGKSNTRAYGLQVNGKLHFLRTDREVICKTSEIRKNLRNRLLIKMVFGLLLLVLPLPISLMK